MKKKKIGLDRKLFMKKEIISGLSTINLAAIEGGGSIANCPSAAMGCPSNKVEMCNHTQQQSCQCGTDPITGIGNVSLCNPTQISLDLCQGNTMEPCQGGISK